MSDLAAPSVYYSSSIPCKAAYIVIPLLLLGFSVSVLVLIVVHSALFLLSLLLLAALVSAVALWNTLRFCSHAPILSFLRSFPDSDLALATHGHLVKITGHASSASVSLESSYEKATRCIYASTSLYECKRISLISQSITRPYSAWTLVYTERLSTDFYITDTKTGIRAMVKAGPGTKLVPLITETKLVNTTKHRNILSHSLRNWLRDRNLSTEARKLRLNEGYVQEGSCISVMGMLHNNNGHLTIVQPPDVISTGCIWRKLLFPIHIDGLILAVSQTSGTSLGHGSLGNQQQLTDI